MRTELEINGQRPINGDSRTNLNGMIIYDGVCAGKRAKELCDEEFCPACDCLRQIAHHTGVRFVSEVVELPDDELDCSLNAIHERAHIRTPVAEAIVPVPGWPGITLQQH
jgi:hypothetical protein